MRRTLPSRPDGGPITGEGRDTMTLVDSLTSFTCKRFSRHVAAEVQPLGGGFYNKVLFWIHWAICPFCRRYWEEIKAMGQVQKVNSALAKPPAVRIAEVKQRLKEKLLKRVL